MVVYQLGVNHWTNIDIGDYICSNKVLCLIPICLILDP